MFRSHNLGELTLSDVNKEVTLCGWVQKVRNLGGMTFVDLRDRYGKTQIVFNSDDYSGDFEEVKKLSMEDVISVSGKVQKRSKGAINTEMNTGEIEVIINEMEILNEAAPLPFVISDRKTDEYVSIARNENHFVDGLPYLDSIIYLNVGDKTAKRIGLRKNQFQLARTDSVMRFSDIKEFSKIDHLELAPYEGIAGGAIVLEFNNRTEKLSNKKITQIINSIDKIIKFKNKDLLTLSSLSIITNSGVILFLIKECIPRLSPQIEFNLNLPPVLGSGNETIHSGLFID